MSEMGFFVTWGWVSCWECVLVYTNSYSYYHPDRSAFTHRVLEARVLGNSLLLFPQPLVIARSILALP